MNIFSPLIFSVFLTLLFVSFQNFRKIAHRIDEKNNEILDLLFITHHIVKDLERGEMLEGGDIKGDSQKIKMKRIKGFLISTSSHCEENRFSGYFNGTTVVEGRIKFDDDNIRFFEYSNGKIYFEVGKRFMEFSISLPCLSEGEIFIDLEDVIWYDKDGEIRRRIEKDGKFLSEISYGKGKIFSGSIKVGNEELRL